MTGPPGIGKSTLAYLIARELGLGRVLQWSIVSRSTLRSGLYDYDAIGRAQTVAELAARTGGDGTAADGDGPGEGDPPRASVGEFLTLGPLGTALLPYRRPRILLVDELDKGDIDLPNDLLHVLENGSFDIPELVRTGAQQVEVHTDDPQGRTVVQRGRVECAEFPIVVMTSNGEREFPAAFRRRCLPWRCGHRPRSCCWRSSRGICATAPTGWWNSWRTSRCGSATAARTRSTSSSTPRSSSRRKGSPEGRAARR